MAERKFPYLFLDVTHHEPLLQPGYKIIPYSCITRSTILGPIFNVELMSANVGLWVYRDQQCDSPFSDLRTRVTSRLNAH